ncbi:MAG: Ig-like domain-containing protein [Candidatus Saganbacteria bacterium]|nr:Ig-like domain-containing protein [Candidatus Saganbacteria bacterium]
MRKIILSYILLSCLVTFSVVLYSCGESSEDSTKTLTGINVQPGSATLEVGGSQTFTAYADYSDGSTGAVVATWSVSGEVGTVLRVGYSGLFTASAEGSGTVNAAYSGLSGAAAVTVRGSTAESLASIYIMPDSVNLRVNQSQVFNSVGYSGSGEAMAISPVWSLSGDSIGSLSYSGTTATLEISAQGTATIFCASGEVSGEAIVTIEGYVVEITVETDTYVEMNDPGSYHGSDTSLKAGYVSLSGDQFETYLYFDISTLPSGASVESATLMIYPSSTGSSILQLKKLTSPFTGTTTWGARPSVGEYLTGQDFDSGEYNNLRSDELNDLVADWLTGTATNYGLAILQEGTEDGTVVILSLENGVNYPVLEIQYSQ